MKFDKNKYKQIKKQDIITGKRKSFGQIYHFVYNPKYKDILPFWDKYPVIILINMNSKHILGLNLHFVPTYTRKKIVNYILKVNASRISNNQPLMVKYSFLKRMIIKLRATICIRKYIISRMSSRVITPIGYKDYVDAVIELKTKRIYGMTQDQIYGLLLKNKGKKK